MSASTTNRTNSTKERNDDDNVSLYEILELQKTASHDEIVKSYYKLAIKYHPDKNPNDVETRKKYDDVNIAYKTLSDHQQRSIYDLFGRIGLSTANKYGLRFSESRWFKCMLLGLIIGLAVTSLCCCCCCCCNCCCNCCGYCNGTSEECDDDKDDDGRSKRQSNVIPLKELEDMQKKSVVENVNVRHVTNNDGIEYIDANPPTVLTCKITKTEEIKASI